ncbi:MAG: DNA primase DnaG [Candidatus Methanospirare jalkutatii]|nr:DNA primase DnaG [Candidatus Methanospirare jalkutatii]
MQENSMKYVIHAHFRAEGFVERSDVIGAIFGQTEGLLGDELDLRNLQKSGKIGRIEVVVSTQGGKSTGEILIPSSLDKVETALIAAALETIDRVGPCIASVEVTKLEDIRAEKRRRIVERAKELLRQFKEQNIEGERMVEEVRNAVKVEEITQYKGLPAGPNVEDADAVIIVEGRADVLNLLKCGIKNVVAVEGTNIPKEIIDLCRRKTVTAFFDGDRGGELLLKELLQVADVDFVAFPPENRSVEDLTYKEIVKALHNKIPVEQYEQFIERKEQHRIRLRRKSAEKAEAESEEEHRATHPHTHSSTSFSALSPLPPTHSPLHTPTPSPTPRGGEIEETVASVSKDEEATALRRKKHPLERMLSELEGTFKARLLDSDWNVLKETTVRDLVSELRAYNGGEVDAVVFDGVVTQRIVDLAMQKGLKFVVGVKRGDVVRVPVSLKIFTAD